mmetsp:Transcript_19389/g.49112  ORF Transcript_19389/g.49112 Transcript_19389/m.49112 type:complete len:331 (+) Transcript_19389:2220-3212(+)
MACCACAGDAGGTRGSLWGSLLRAGGVWTIPFGGPSGSSPHLGHKLLPKLSLQAIHQQVANLEAASANLRRTPSPPIFELACDRPRIGGSLCGLLEPWGLLTEQADGVRVVHARRHDAARSNFVKWCPSTANSRGLPCHLCEGPVGALAVRGCPPKLKRRAEEGRTGHQAQQPARQAPCRLGSVDTSLSVLKGHLWHPHRNVQLREGHEDPHPQACLVTVRLCVRSGQEQHLAEHLLCLFPLCLVDQQQAAVHPHHHQSVRCLRHRRRIPSPSLRLAQCPRRILHRRHTHVCPPLLDKAYELANVAGPALAHQWLQQVQQRQPQRLDPLR